MISKLSGTYSNSPTLLALVSYLTGRRSEILINLFIDSIHEGDRILDIGSGLGEIIARLDQRVKVNIQSTDIKDKRIFGRDLPFTKTVGERLPFRDNEFDVVLISAVLHHCREPLKVLAEARRVSKDRVIVLEDCPGGLLEKYQVYFIDSLLNLEFIGHPHNNKTVVQWREVFKDMNFKLIHENKIKLPFIYAFYFPIVCFILQKTK